MKKAIRSDDIRSYMKSIGNADIIVGIPSYNNVGTIACSERGLVA